MLVRIRPLGSLSIPGAPGFGCHVGGEGCGFGVAFSPSGRIGVGSGSVVRMGISQQVGGYGAAQVERSFEVRDGTRIQRGCSTLPEGVDPHAKKIGNRPFVDLAPLDEPQLALQIEGAVFGHGLSAFSASWSKMRISIPLISLMSSR